MKTKALLALALSCCIFQASAAVKIPFWHAMAGTMEQTLNEVVAQFNKSQSSYEIVPVYKGNYTETLTSAVAAFRAHQQPAIVQIFEVGTATLLRPKGVVVPFYEVMKKAGRIVSSNDFISAIASYYSTQQGKLVALPFNSSSAVVYYNQDALKKIGVKTLPKTWPALEKISQQLLRDGYHCGFTSAWPSWILLENFSAWHNLPYATPANGFKTGGAPRMAFNNPTTVAHLQALARWQQQGVFQYGGRSDDPQNRFTSGICPIFMQSSGARENLKALVDFHLAVGPMPYWPAAKGAPQNTIIGGAALWTFTGYSDEVYRGVAAFYAFLLQPKMQYYWQTRTGYLPVTKAALTFAKKQGFYRRNPQSKVALDTLMHRVPTENSGGIRLGYFQQIRNITDDTLEAIFSGQETVAVALKQATKQINRLVMRFEQVVSHEGGEP